MSGGAPVVVVNTSASHAPVPSSFFAVGIQVSKKQKAYSMATREHLILWGASMSNISCNETVVMLAYQSYRKRLGQVYNT